VLKKVREKIEVQKKNSSFKEKIKEKSGN